MSNDIFQSAFDTVYYDGMNSDFHRNIVFLSRLGFFETAAIKTVSHEHGRVIRLRRELKECEKNGYHPHLGDIRSQYCRAVATLNVLVRHYGFVRGSLK